MNQANIKRIIGKLCIVILIVSVVGLISGILLYARFSIIQVLCVILGTTLVFFIAWAAVNWGDL